MNAEGRLSPEGLRWNRDSLKHAYWRTALPKGGTRRLQEREVRRILITLSEAAGLERVIRPHALRHRAITAALDHTNGNVRKVQKFARQAKQRNAIRYDATIQDFASEVTRGLGADDWSGVSYGPIREPRTALAIPWPGRFCFE